MCGRYSTAKLRIKDLIDAFGIQVYLPYEEHHNTAPTLRVPVIRERYHQRYLEPLRWGLIPSWAKDKSIGNHMINARMESLAEKPAFKRAYRVQRCIIPASGFYEWQKRDTGKQPYYIYRKDKKPLTFAGLWEHWVDKETGEIIESCTIITREATTQLQVIHDRMPVILDYERAKVWLDPSLEDIEDLRAILEDPRAVLLRMYPVSDYVNSVKNEGERCIWEVRQEN